MQLVTTTTKTMTINTVIICHFVHFYVIDIIIQVSSVVSLDCWSCAGGPLLRLFSWTSVNSLWTHVALACFKSCYSSREPILINNSIDAVCTNGCTWLCKKVKLQTYTLGVCGRLPWTPQLAQRGHHGLSLRTTPGGWGGQSCAAISTQTVAGNESLEHWECYLHTSQVEGKGEIINTWLFIVLSLYYCMILYATNQFCCAAGKSKFPTCIQGEFVSSAVNQSSYLTSTKPTLP